VLCTNPNCVTWVIYAASRSTNGCLHCCCVLVGGALVEAPVIRLDSDPLAPCRGVVEPWFAVVEKGTKMITERSGKSWRIYSQLQVEMERVTAKLHELPKLDHAAHCGRLKVFPNVTPCVVCWSDIALAMVPNPRFSSGPELELNLKHFNGFYPTTNPNCTEPAVFWPVP